MQKSGKTDAVKCHTNEDLQTWAELLAFLLNMDASARGMEWSVFLEKQLCAQGQLKDNPGGHE